MNKGLTIKYLALLLTVSIVSCSSGGSPVSNPAVVNKSDYILDIGAKKGTTLSLKIIPKALENSFQTKAGADGVRAAKVTDVDHYLVYLVRDTNAAGFTPGGDPLGNIVTNGGPFNVPNAGAASRVISFNNVPSDFPNYYYAVIMAKDIGGFDILKANSGFSGSPKIAVSGFGVRVGADLAVSTPTNMAITANLEDAVGATIEAGIVSNSGAEPGNMTATYNPVYNYSISTIAGISGSLGSSDTLIAITSQLNQPNGIAVDNSGNVYIADQNNQVIRKVTPGGAISTIAGKIGEIGPTDTGIATDSRLVIPAGVAVDNAGNVFIANAGNNTIKKVTPGGAISTVAGTGASGVFDDGVATNSQLSFPAGVAVDASGNIYIANTFNHTIRKVTPGGAISTIAGISGSFGTTNTGIATDSRLDTPNGIAVDSSGNIYIADQHNHAIRKVTPGGAISTIAGTIGSSGSATTSRLNNPSGVAVDSVGNVYIADTNNSIIRKVTPGGAISTIAGTGTAGANGDGVATNSRLNLPFGVAIDNLGYVYIANTFNHTIRKLF